MATESANQRSKSQKTYITKGSEIINRIKFDESPKLYKKNSIFLAKKLSDGPSIKQSRNAIHRTVTIGDFNKGKLVTSNQLEDFLNSEIDTTVKDELKQKFKKDSYGMLSFTKKP